MSDVDWYLTPLLVLLAVPYVGGPVAILCMFRLQVPARILFFDPETIELPQEVTGFVDSARGELTAMGFEPAAYFCLPDLVTNAKSINVLLVNARTREGAMINCIYAGAQGSPTQLKHTFTEFVTRFRDGGCVQTNNSRVLSAFRQPANDHTIQFWNEKDLGTLYAMHQRISERLSTAPPILTLTERFGDDVEQYIQTAVLQEPCDYQVEVGLLRRVEGGYRLTFKGAVVFVWQELWPWKWVRRHRLRHAARQWQQEIGMG